MDCLLIFVVALAGGLLPLVVRWSDRLLHSALALSTGIFLGAVFLHMLPELGSFEADHESVAVHAPSVPVSTGDPAAGSLTAERADHRHHGGLPIWLSVLVGVLAVYLLEGLVFRSHDHDDLHRHRAVGYASLVGLSLHSITNGLGLAAANLDHSLRTAVFIAIIAHKGFETFSLATVFLLGEFPRRWILITMVVYAAITPLGFLLGRPLLAHLPPSMVGIALALAVGTFLYVCLCELLPELFHHKEDSAVKIGLLAAGIGVMLLVEGAHP